MSISLGLNGLGSCATQYASEYFDATVYRDGLKYTLHFEKGENVGGLHKGRPPRRKKTGSMIPLEAGSGGVHRHRHSGWNTITDVLKRQAVVNAGVTFVLPQSGRLGTFEETEFRYENGIQDYVAELAGDNALTAPVFCAGRARGPGPGGQAGIQGEDSQRSAAASPTRCSVIEHYHNSSWLEHGGSPEKAMRSASVSAPSTAICSTNSKYKKNESQDHLGRHCRTA